MSISSDTVIQDPRAATNISNDEFKIPVRDYSTGDPAHDIVITGIAGRYPDSDDLDQFWNHLLSGVELATIDDRRWPVGESTATHSCLLL